MKKEENKDKKTLQKLVEKLVQKEVADQFLIKEDVLYNAFVEPFTDIFKTAKHGLEKSVASILGNTRKLAKQWAYACIPFISSAEITRIGKEEDTKLQGRFKELDTGYADVLKRNWDTLRTRDLAGLALMWNPTLTVGSHIALESPAVALNILEVLSGGNPKIVELRKKAEELSKKVMPPASGGGGSSGGGGGGPTDLAQDDYGMGGGWGESALPRGAGKGIIKEQEPVTAQPPQKTGFTREELDKKVYAVLQQLLKRKDVQRSIQNSPATKMLKTAGLDAVAERVKKITQFTTMEQFESYVGPDLAKFKQEIQAKIPKDTPPETLKQLGVEQVQELKKVYRDIYTKYVQDLSKTTPGIEAEVKKVMDQISKLG